MFFVRSRSFSLSRNMRLWTTGRPTRIHHAIRNYNNNQFNRCISMKNQENGQELPLPPMANLYQEWTLEQDKLLWESRNQSPVELASLLGRGMRGVTSRLAKLQDVSSPAYERLFASHNKNNQNDDEENYYGQKKEKLVPVGEVLRRIEWDYMLEAKDFFVLHYDRLDDRIVESPMDAPNTSIPGKETLLSKALPEHRIVGIKYKERVVWDRNARLDLVFSGEGIYHVMETYDTWKQERDQVLAWNRERQAIVSQRMRQILGLERFAELQEYSTSLQQFAATNLSTLSLQSELEVYVQNALKLFRQARQDPSTSLEPSIIPTSDYLALDEFSELIAVLPDVYLRNLILQELSVFMSRVDGGDNNKTNGSSSDEKKNQPKVAVTLDEDDLTETFVRGSGPGGQKVNKTSNRVLLVHEPTQLRVECQDTRSLQQNRKIARKRLAEKLDEYYNGKQSKTFMKQQKASEKRKKSKAKNRARVKKKQLEKEEASNDNSNPDPLDDFY